MLVYSASSLVPIPNGYGTQKALEISVIPGLSHDGGFEASRLFRRDFLSLTKCFAEALKVRKPMVYGLQVTWTVMSSTRSGFKPS